MWTEEPLGAWRCLTFGRGAGDGAVTLMPGEAECVEGPSLFHVSCGSSALEPEPSASVSLSLVAGVAQPFPPCAGRLVAGLLEAQ